MKCSNPDLWGSRPGPKATDDEIARYLEHLQNCPLHAELERRESGAVQQAVDLACMGQQLDGLHDTDDFLDWQASGSLVAALVLRVDGELMARLDSASLRRSRIEVGRGRILELLVDPGTGAPWAVVSIIALDGIRAPITRNIRVSDNIVVRLAFDPGPPVTVAVKARFSGAKGSTRKFISWILQGGWPRQLAAVAACAAVLIIVAPLLPRLWQRVTGHGLVEEPYRSASSLALMGPASDAVIEPYQEFRWQPIAPGMEYDIEIDDTETGKIVLRRTTHDASLLLNPQDYSTLTPDRRYQWSVQVKTDGRRLRSEPRIFRTKALQGRSDYRRYPAAARQKWEEGILKAAPRDFPAWEARIAKAIATENNQLSSDLAWLQFLQARLFLAKREKGRAATMLKSALNMWETLGAPDELLYARTLINYASAEQDIGQLGASLTAGEHALQILRRRDDTQYLQMRSNCLLNLGVLLRQLNLPERAKAAYLEMIALDQRRAAGADVIAEDLNNLGNVLVEDLEDVAGGLHWLEESLRQQRIFIAQHHKEANSYGITLDSLAKAYRLVGRTSESQARYRESLAYDEKMGDFEGYVETLNNAAEALEEQKQYGQARRYYEKASRAIEQHPDINPEVIWPTIDGVGRMHLINGEISAAASQFEEAIRIVEGLSRSLSRFAEQRVFRAGHTIPYYDRARIALLRQDWPDMFRHMEGGRTTLTYPPSAGRPSPVTLTGLQHSLLDRDLAIEYLIGDKEDPVLLLAVTRANAYGLELSSGKQIESAVAKLAEVLPSGSKPAAEDAISKLSTLLLPDSVLQIITSEGITRIIMSPDLSIGRIPFEALSLNRSASTPIFQQAVVSSVPSLSWWSSAQSASVHQDTKSALIVGEPPTRSSFGCGVSEGLTMGLRFTPLPHAKAEAQMIVDYAGKNAVQLTSDHARVAEWLGRRPEEYGILHFATHGHATGSLESSFLLFGCTDHPELFTGTDIESLHLRGQIVVLSACDTHNGRPLRGEGVDSLASAFFRAGARAVIATRWSIRDDVPQPFMESFYRNLSRGATVGVALQRAQVKTLQEFRDIRVACTFSLLGSADATAALTPGWRRRFRDWIADVR